MDYLPRNSNRLDHSYRECSLSLACYAHIKHYWDYILFNGRGRGRRVGDLVESSVWKCKHFYENGGRHALLGNPWTLIPTCVSYLFHPSFVSVNPFFLLHACICSFFVFHCTCLDVTRIRFRGWRNYGDGQVWN